METRTFRMKRWLVFACVVGAVALFGGRPGSAVEFHSNACEVQASEVERCQSMDPADYVTGLLLHPPRLERTFNIAPSPPAITVVSREASLRKESNAGQALI